MATVLLPGCELVGQLTSSRVVAGSVLFVPPIDTSEFPQLSNQVRNQVKVYYGDRTDVDGKTKLVPREGGSLRLVYPLAPHGIALTEETVMNPRAKKGFYILDLDRVDVELLPHEEYRIEAVEDGQVYSVTVTAPEGVPDEEAIQTTPIEHAVNTPLSIPHPGDDRLAFVLVRWAPDDERPECTQPEKLDTYSSIPKSSKDINDLAKDDSRWRADPIVIPAEAFPRCGIYAVVMAAMSRGSGGSGNLFIGSQLFAGKATGQVYEVR